MASIGPGFLLLVGVHREDSEAQAKKLAEKIANLRIFNDENGKMNIALQDMEAHDVLAVSNFTVYGDTLKSRRPSFVESASFDHGRAIFDNFVESLRTYGFRVPTGVFGADMAVTLVNEGPVTLIVDV